MTKALSWVVVGAVTSLFLPLGFGVIALGDADDFIIAKAFFLVACLFWWAKIIHLGFGFRGRKLMTYLFVFIGCGAVGILALAATQYVDRKYAAKLKKSEMGKVETLEPPIYPAFQAIYDRHKEKLGKPLEGQEETVYQPRHEKATIIWIDGQVPFYVLLDENKQLKTIQGKIVTQNTWYFDADNRKRTNTPKGKNPPYGTVAMAWVDNPEWWEREVGWREWHCEYSKGVIHIQRFEHGLIIGDLRRMEKDYRVVVYILFTDEGTWDWEMPERRPPPCEEPSTDKNKLKTHLEKNPVS